MANSNGYTQWLADFQCKRGFVNNYWCAALLFSMNKRSQRTFNIPYFIIEEELEKENKNVHLDSLSKVYVSHPLTHFLVHLLKQCRPDTTLSNYESSLREFLNQQYILPPGIANPLTPSTSFHSLPTECKLWILCCLMDYATFDLGHLYKDKDRNNFYLISPCRLYVRIESPDEKSFPFDDDQLNSFAWGSLFRHLNYIHFKLLSENKQEWDVIWQALLKHKANNVYNAIRTRVEMEFAKCTSLMIQRDNERRDFNKFLSSLSPIPAITPKENNQDVFNSNMPMNEAAPKDCVSNPSEERSQEGLIDVTQKKEKIREVSKMENENEMEAKAKRRCRRFPQCHPHLVPNCPYKHPRTLCRYFPNPPCRGMFCSYRHPFCSNDGRCEDDRCPFEHEKSQPTLSRQRRNTVERPGNVPRQKSVTRDDTNGRKTSSSNQAQSRSRLKSRVHTGISTNGNEPSLNGTAGNEPSMNNDNSRKSSNTVPVHHRSQSRGRESSNRAEVNGNESLPVAMRNRRNINNEPPRGMRRSGSQASLGRMSTVSASTNGRESRIRRSDSRESLGTISTVAGDRQSRMRRPSIGRSGYNKSRSSDDESIASSATALNNKMKIKIRCLFFRRCTKDNCKYVHPTEQCTAFPKCPNGGGCIFLHKTCPDDGVCCNERCTNEHEERHHTNKKWCSKGSFCKKIDCDKLHPEECIDPCPTPGNCWKYHRPSPSPTTRSQNNRNAPPTSPFGVHPLNPNAMGPYGPNPMMFPPFPPYPMYQNQMGPHPYPSGPLPPPYNEDLSRGRNQQRPTRYSREELEFVNRKIAEGQ
ncbi:hypothetical protein PFISCL1PPCAC_1705 [Pristionchus fissidentatus]|uniref:Zinc finger CCCH domain-containing protein 14 n=1 Tax=Pristionchus fissidentatus TaxID=1538716 RepID=A0AAV5UW70_9BILA|nr:hypothetical protein PFISCL1PPCAC_1705 [Pristionchus fissidentatus]